MARKTTVIIALLIAALFAVAIVPAQDSSRRRASVYAGASEGADLAPSPEPGLMPVEGTSPATPLPAAPPTVIPRGANQGQVAPAGVFGRRRAGGSLSNQLHASGEAASEDYTPSPATTAPDTSTHAPAQVSPPEGAVPMPTDASEPSSAAPAAESSPAAEVPAEPANSRSVLKRTKTGITEESTRPPVVPSMPSTARPGSISGSSRRTVPTPAITTPNPYGAARRSVPAIDTSAITAVAVTGRSPALRVDVAGPQALTVGKPAGYLVTIVNEGEATASDVQLRLSLPGFVTVTGSQPTNGQADMQADASGQARLAWSLPSIPGRGHESLRLELVASEGQPFEMGVEWVTRPTTLKADITVRQAQLALSLAGPADMTYGEEKAFTLSVSNPGNGDAENVVINLSSGENRRQQIEVGTLPAGQRKEVPVQIVASQPGEMEIHAVAAGDGGLSAEAAGKVIVRKAELAVLVEGPELKFAGAEAVYQVTIQNAGNAAADNVQITTTLPVASRYAGGIEGVTPAGAALKWKLATLPAGSEKTYELRLVLNGAGPNRVAVQAQAPAAGAANGEVETLVEAAADLKLMVNDPSGPLGTSEMATYEIQLTNRGSDAARQVKIVMQFGERIEPISFEGAEGKIVPGQVVCQPLAELGAGEQVTMRVKARSDRGGTHQFRVEVTCNESETRLVSEGTTRFFAESGRTGSAAATAKKPTLVPQGGTFQR
jgi:hypothetical protein